MAIIIKNENEMTTLFNGCVIYQGYEDVRVMSDVWESQLYAIVYDVINGPRKIWAPTGTVKIEVDASIELLLQYKKYNKAIERHNKAMDLCHQHNYELNFAHEHGLTLFQYRKLKHIYGGDTLKGCFELLKVKKFKSKFRESLATQLRNWLNDPEPKYDYPFSWKQAECVKPYKCW